MYRFLHEHKFSIFSGLNRMLKSAISASNYNYILSYLGNSQKVFQKGYTIFHFYQQCMNDTISLYPCQGLVVSLVFYFSHFYRCVVVSHYGIFPCITFIANEIKHIFMCLSSVYTLVKCSFTYFILISNWSFIYAFTLTLFL